MAPAGNKTSRNLGGKYVKYVRDPTRGQQVEQEGLLNFSQDGGLSAAWRRLRQHGGPDRVFNQTGGAVYVCVCGSLQH